MRWSRRIEEVGTKLPDARRLLSAPPHGATDVAKGEYVRPLGGMACAKCHSGDAFKVGDDIDAISRATVSVTSSARAIRNSARRIARALLTPPGESR